MKQKKWFSYFSIILCILIAVPHNTGGMQLTIDVLRELAPLVAHATASLCMYAAASKQAFIHNYLHHNAQLQQVASSYNPHTWDTIQSLQEVNHTILTNNCAASYDLIYPTAPDLPPIEITSAPEQSDFETAYDTEPLDCSAISYYVPSAHQLSFKAPLLSDTQHHIQVMCTAQKTTGIDHLRQAETDYKEHKDYYAHTLSYDNQESAQFYGHLHFIQDVVAHCNDTDYITRIKARLLCPNIYNKDFFFDDHSWVVANSLSYRYFNHNGALINIDDDLDLAWTIFPFADEIFNGHHLMPTLIDPHCCSAWQQLVHYVGGCTKLLIQRGCERFLGPTAQSVRENQRNLNLMHLINLCERYEWEQAEQFLQQQTHSPNQFIFLDTIYRTIKKQRINKYYITVNANDDLMWLNLSEATKKIISNNFELRKLCNTYFLARHELRKLGKNPDDYELAIDKNTIEQYVQSLVHKHASFYFDSESNSTPPNDPDPSKDPNKNPIPPEDPEKSNHNSNLPEHNQEDKIGLIKKPKIEFFEKNAKHIFKKAHGHFTEDTPENRKLIIDLVSDIKNLLGPDRSGNQWYSKILPSGKQLWASVRDGVIRNCGLNEIPKTYNNITGLCRLYKP